MLWRLGSPWGPLPASVGIRARWSDRASSAHPSASECKRVPGGYQGDLYRMVTSRIRLSRSVMAKAVAHLHVPHTQRPRGLHPDQHTQAYTGISFRFFPSRLCRCCMKSKGGSRDGGLKDNGQNYNTRNELANCSARFSNCPLFTGYLQLHFNNMYCYTVQR